MKLNFNWYEITNHTHVCITYVLLFPPSTSSKWLMGRFTQLVKLIYNYDLYCRCSNIAYSHRYIPVLALVIVKIYFYIYRKVASSNTSWLEAYACFFRLLMQHTIIHIIELATIRQLTSAPLKKIVTCNGIYLLCLLIMYFMANS